MAKPRRAEHAAGERRPSADRPPRARLFVALDLPPQARAALVEWQARALESRQDLRPVAADALHVTLAFLGHRPEEEIEPIAKTVERAITGLPPAPLAVNSIVGVPKRRPRLYALDLTDPEQRAAALHNAVAGALAENGFYKPEKRAFWPHVTVARVPRSTSRNTPPPQQLDPPPAPFIAHRLTLYRSHLGRGPARYEPLRQVELDP